MKQMFKDMLFGAALASGAALILAGWLAIVYPPVALAFRHLFGA